MNTSRLALLSIASLTFAALSGCSTPSRQAPVIDRPTPSASSARVRPLPPPPADDSKDRGTYTVRRGDTQARIAFDHGQNYRDLQAWNNLADPNDIKVGQVLRLSAPEHGAGTPASGAVVTSPISMPGADKPPVVAAVPKKTAPRGDKQPYSEAAAADTQKDEVVEPKKPVASSALAAGSTVTASDDDKMSWMWPSNGKIIATFDEGKSKGIDIAGKMGQQVMAAGSGKVMYAGSGIRGYGNLVIVKHSNNLRMPITRRSWSARARA